MKPTNGKKIAHCKIHTDVEEQYPCHVCRGEGPPAKRKRSKKKARGD